MGTEELNDAIIRSNLVQNLVQGREIDSNAMIVEELGLKHGRARIDLAIVGAEIHGYEIKSNVDTLGRLEEQARTFNLILDRVTLVVGDKHLGQVIQLIPEWWGLIVAFRTIESSIAFAEVRKARPNPTINAFAYIQLLWRDEALEMLSRVEHDEALWRQPKDLIYSRVVESFNMEKIRESVTGFLKSRTDWRSGAPQR